MIIKRLISTIIAISTIFCFALTASAETVTLEGSGITPRYKYAASVSSYLTINGTTGICDSIGNGMSGVTKIVVTQTIEKHWALGIFIRVDNASWTTTVNSMSAFVTNKKYNLPTGTYRMVTDFTFYMGNQSEKITVYSSEEVVS